MLRYTYSDWPVLLFLSFSKQTAIISGFCKSCVVKWRILYDVIILPYLTSFGSIFPPNRVHISVIVTQTRCLWPTDWLLKCYLQKFNASGMSYDRPNKSSFPWFFPVYSTCSVRTELHCAAFRLPTATVLHSAAPKCCCQHSALTATVSLYPRIHSRHSHFQSFHLPHFSSLYFTAFTRRTSGYWLVSLKAWTAQSVQCLATGSVSTVPSYRLSQYSA